MGTITSGVGLISGFDYKTLIDQLLEIDARPRDQLLTRVGTLDAQKAAYLDLSARVTALLGRIERLTRASTFRAATATSSAEDVLSATASSGARPGAYSFTVAALASSHQFVSRGFTSAAAPLSAGVLTVESARARVNTSTQLAELNGHTGVRRGAIKLVNAAGVETTVDLSDALTVGDVVARINAAGGGVRAAVQGNALTLTDTSGVAGALRVHEVGGGHTAEDLGFGLGHAYSTTGELVGREVLFVGAGTPISALNDSLGVRHALAGGDFDLEAGGQSFRVDLSDIVQSDTRLARLNHGQGVRTGRVRITARDGSIAEVDLTGVETIAEVQQRLESAFGGNRITVTLSGSRLILNDKTDVTDLSDEEREPLVISDLTGYAARDLGIDGSGEQGRIDGRDVLHMDTIADVLSAVNYATGNQDANKQPVVQATLRSDGLGLQLQTSGGPLTIKVADDGQGLRDLGFAAGTYYDLGGGAVAVGQRLIGGIDSVLLRTLNGGAGFDGSGLQITANGATLNLNLSSAATLADVITRINSAAEAAGAGIEAGYDSTGTKLVITNLASPTAINVSGAFAEALGLAGSGLQLTSADLQRQYVGEATPLSTLNAGRGVNGGKLRVTTADGAYHDLDLSSPSIRTVGDVLDQLNVLPGVAARINDTGDGILVTDTTSGAGRLTIAELGGTAARDLNLLGTADENGRIDGSFEFKLEIGGSETLATLAARIGAETTLATASVLNDGSGFTPYRLNIGARVSGAAGELIVDDGALGLGVTMLTRAQDARVFLGGNAGSGMLLTSASNTFENVIDGVTFTVNAVSDEPVTVKVERDIEAVIEDMQGIVEDFNSTMDRIKDVGAYDPETEKAAILQGEGTLRTIERRFYRALTEASVGGVRLADFGLKPTSGNHLEFDEEKFRAAFAANPDAVEQFFADEDAGVAAKIKEQLDQLAGSEGIIPGQTETLDERKELLNERVETLNERLERKRARLLRQFQQMETALAQMQSQQSTLTNLASLVQTFANAGSTSTG